MIPCIIYCCFCLLLLLLNNIATIAGFTLCNNGAVTIGQTYINTRRSTSSSSTTTTVVFMLQESSNNNDNNLNINNNWYDFFNDNNYDKSFMDATLVELVELMEEADVGQDLLDEVTMMQDDTSIVELPVMFSGEVGTETSSSFDFERWELHRSPDRYSRLLVGAFTGITTRRIFPTVLFLIAWSTLVDVYNSVEHLYGLPEIELPLTPFELAVPVLGLLLVFRSNTSFERFNDGSDATWEITSRFRSIIRQLLSFTSIPGRFPPEERGAAYELVDACLVLHGWILCDYLRSSSDNKDGARDNNNNNNTNKISPSQNKQAKILQKALALPYDVTKQLLTTQNDDGSQSSLPRQSPSGLINTVTLGIFNRMPSLDPQESVMLEEQFTQIISSLGTCEKLIRTPIPLGYTRYSVRFLMIWLTLLPLALVRTFAEFGIGTWWENKPQPVLVIVMIFLSVAFLSIEDISVQLEEPFCVLPLDLHQKWLKLDFTQMKRTSRLVDGMSQKSKLKKRTLFRNWILRPFNRNKDNTSS